MSVEHEELQRTAEPRAWLMLVAGDDRQHGGNDGYQDQLETSYSWDETVPNHASVRPGDYIALWDKHRLLGVSLIEKIDRARAEKILRRCPRCRGAHLKARKHVEPRYRCFKCRRNFDEAEVSLRLLRTYRSDHAAGWSDLTGRLTGHQLRALCHSPRSQLSIRSLDWTRFDAALAGTGCAPVSNLDQRVDAIHGHRSATARVRVGQKAFRDRMLGTFGSVCALTGPAPSEALEAAHLYSYAALGVHHDHGGLLLRRDVHRLFDEGLITVEPTTLRVQVDPTLREFEQYARLDSAAPTVALTDGHRQWLELHWSQHQSSSANSK